METLSDPGGPAIPPVFTNNRGRAYVSYPVPVDLIDEVNAFVARMTAARTFGTVPGRDPLDPTPAPSEEAVLEFSPAGPAKPLGRGSAATEVGNPNGVWDVHEYFALQDAGTTSCERIIRLLNALGERGADGLASTSELAQVTGIEEKYLRSALSKLTQFIEHRPEVYGVQVRWPFGWKYGRHVSQEHPREFHYYVSEEQHAAWLMALRADGRLIRALKH